MSVRTRVVVVRFGALGDVVLITPLLRALHRRHPELPITLVTKQAYAPVLETHPAVDQVIALGPDGGLRSLARRLAIAKDDIVLDLHGSLRSYALRVLTGGDWHSYRKERQAQRRRLRGGVLPPDRPVAEKYFSAAESLGVEPDGAPAELFTNPEDETHAAEYAAPGSIVLAPGAAQPTKRWPADHWRALARDLDRRGVNVIGLGTPTERELLDGTPAADAFGLPIRTAVAICRQAAVVVAQDSGLMHVAAAVGTPVVALFGPTTPEFGFGPYRARATILQRSLPCRPCSVYGTDRCPEDHHRCLREIDPPAVARAVVEAA